MKNKMHQEAECILRECDFSVTKPRVLILSTLMVKAQPITIDALQKSIGTSVNYVTFYRVLKQFVREGIVHQTDFRDGKAYFEYQDTDHHHHHITCTLCGIHEDTDDCHENDDYKHVLTHSKSFSYIASHTLEFFGICKQCSK